MSRISCFARPGCPKGGMSPHGRRGDCGSEVGRGIASKGATRGSGRSYPPPTPDLLSSSGRQAHTPSEAGRGRLVTEGATVLGTAVGFHFPASGLATQTVCVRDEPHGSGFRPRSAHHAFVTYRPSFEGVHVSHRSKWPRAESCRVGYRESGTRPRRSALGGGRTRTSFRPSRRGRAARTAVVAGLGQAAASLGECRTRLLSGPGSCWSITAHHRTFRSCAGQEAKPATVSRFAATPASSAVALLDSPLQRPGPGRRCARVGHARRTRNLRSSGGHRRVEL